MKFLLLYHIKICCAAGMLFSFRKALCNDQSLFKLQFVSANFVSSFSAIELSVEVFSISGSFHSWSSGAWASHSLIWSMRAPLCLGTDLWMYLLDEEDRLLWSKSIQLWRRNKPQRSSHSVGSPVDKLLHFCHTHPVHAEEAREERPERLT